ncbi:unnamed protein product [Darwinula stevensoni]|uniref:THAP9-like helix-turn-helix domain-containing protein n=1 Tax=Darwinula stevensoni TaxID=69355 RepID=A0A7R9FT61_9CRUS|nr:unnamed protein product [Darwinula stevensoni]CAG0904015.1 unnamed protein product [Darwinula stevensoni]
MMKKRTSRTSTMARSPAPAVSFTEDSRTFSQEQHDPLLDHNYHIYVSPRKLKRKLDEVTSALVESKRLVKVSGQKLSRLQQKSKPLKDVIDHLRDEQRLRGDILDILESNFSGCTLKLLKRQMGNRKDTYSPTLRAFALTLNLYSREAYEYVRKTFGLSLPHTRTLSRWYQHVDGAPGFTGRKTPIIGFLIGIQTVEKIFDEYVKPPSSPIHAHDESVLLIKRKNRGGLVCPSSSVIIVCTVTEKCLRQLGVSSQGYASSSPDLLLRLQTQVMRKLNPVSLFPSLQDHFLKNHALSSHLYMLVKKIVDIYLKVRLHHIGRETTAHLQGSTAYLMHPMVKAIWRPEDRTASQVRNGCATSRDLLYLSGGNMGLVNGLVHMVLGPLPPGGWRKRGFDRCTRPWIRPLFLRARKILKMKRIDLPSLRGRYDTFPPPEANHFEGFLVKEGGEYRRTIFLVIFVPLRSRLHVCTDA